MRRFLLIVTVLVVVSIPVLAQEHPIPPRRTNAAKVGFFGGFTPGWLFVDVDPINQYLTEAGGAPLSDGGVPLFGGGGAVYIGVVNNFRLGGVGMGGSRSSHAVDAQGVRRDASLGVGFGGITLEYVLPVVERLDIAVGGMLGWGGIDLTLRQDVGSNLTWNEEWTSFGSGDYTDPVTGQIRNITRVFSGSFFVWAPSVNVEYAVLGWLAFRVGATYVGMSAPSWTVDGEYDLIGVPEEVNGQGFMVNAGIFVGTF